MKIFEFIVDDYTKYKFGYYVHTDSDGTQWKYLSFDKIFTIEHSRVSSLRLIIDGKIVWRKKLSSVIANEEDDCTVDSPEARRYMEKITRNLAFA